MMVNVWLAAVAAIYSSVMAAYDRFVVARSIDMVILLLRTLGTIYVLQVGWGLWGLAWTIVFGNILSVIANRIYAGKCHSGLKSFPFLYSKKRFKELFGYGSYAFITSAAVKIIGQSDLIIVGAVLSVSDVRQYSIGAMLIYYSATFIKIISRTYFPAVQRAVGGGRMAEVKDLFFRQLQISLIFGILVYVGYYFYSQPFIKLWMMQSTFDLNDVKISSEIMSFLAVSCLPLLIITPCQNILAATGQIRLTAILSIVEALLNVILSLSFVIIFNFGLIGVAAGTTASRLLVPSIFIPYFFCRELHIPLRLFIAKSIQPAIVSTGILSVFCFTWINNYAPVGWLSFIFHILITVSIWIFISFFILVPVDIRERFLFFLKLKSNHDRKIL